MKKWKTAAIIGACLLTSVVSLLVLFSLDGAPPDVSDLIQPRPEPPPPEDNAYTYFVEAAKLLKDEDDIWKIYHFLWRGGTHYQTFTDERIRLLLADNLATLEKLREGLGREICLLPPLESIFQPYDCNLKIRNLAYLLLIQSKIAADDGDTLLSQNCVVETFRLAIMLMNNPEGYIGSMIARDANGPATKLALDNTTPTEILERLLGELSMARAISEFHVAAAKIELEMLCRELIVDDIKGSLEKCFEGEPLPYIIESGWYRIPFFYQRNNTRSLLAARYRELVANIPKPLAEQSWESELLPKPNVENVFSVARLLLSPNLVGKLVIEDLNWIGGNRSLSHYADTEASLSGLRLVLALQLRWRGTGEFPDSLECLVPDYLAALPRDPFDGLPFRYSRERGIVYAIGKNLFDDGGAGDDVVFKFKADVDEGE